MVKKNEDADHLLELMDVDIGLRKRLESGDIEAWREAVTTLKELHQSYASPGKICRATSARPNTEQKLTVLCKRRASGETLWNDADVSDKTGCGRRKTANHVDVFVFEDVSP